METFSDTIRNIPFFSGIAREDLARITGKLEEEKYASGQVIFKQGDSGEALYVVRSGAVEVVLENGAVAADSLAMLSAHDCFGEMALFTGEKRSATVRAFVDSTVLKLSKENWEELLRKYPSLALHFCKVLSRRLADTDKDVSRGRGAFMLVMEEVFTGQPSEIRDFLTRTAELNRLDPGVIKSVLSIPDPIRLLECLARAYPPFLSKDEHGCYRYRGHLREFLISKFKQTFGKPERQQLHLKYSEYFSENRQWLPAIEHYLEAEEWQLAADLIHEHADQLLGKEKVEELHCLVESFPEHEIRSSRSLTRFRAQLLLRLGDLPSAIRSYQDYLGHNQVSRCDTIEMAQFYQELADLHRRNGELGDALGCLQMGATMIEQGNGSLDAVEALRSIETLQQQRGTGQEALSWGNRALKVAQRLRAAKAENLFGINKTGLGLALAIMTVFVVWQLPAQAPLTDRGVHFLAIFLGIVILWAFEIFEEHVVAILMLLSWLVLDIVPTKTALAGFGESSWFFALGVLGIGAALTTSGLLYRFGLQLLRILPPIHKIYSFSFLTAGLFVTPLFPVNKGRIGIIAPLTHTISEALGYGNRSSGSAGLAFSSMVGFTQLTFMFLTGATYCLVGWNVMPANARAEFGWLAWFGAALPAGLLTILLFYFAIQFLFPVNDKESRRVPKKTLLTQMEILGPLTSGEWIGLGVIALAAIGWLGKPFHGIGESWVALSAFAIFLMTGLLDKKGLKNGIDWGYLLFLGVVSALDDIMKWLRVDAWLNGVVAPVLSSVSFSPLLFLFTVAVMVYALRFLLKKPATVVLFMVTLAPLAQQAAIHPGVLLLTILIAIEAWFLPYQTDSYQIAYYSTDEKAFSHAQGRTLMMLKFIVSFVTIAASIPYWRMLGWIR